MAAGNVAAEYSFRIPATMFYALTISIVYYFSSFAFPAFIVSRKRKTRFILCTILLICAIVVWVGGLSIMPLHWQQTESVHNGYLLNFTVLLRESFPKKPSDYSPEIVEKIAQKYICESDQENGKKPDIIVIMDESFADMNRLGNSLHTNEIITPFIDGLKDNTVRGYALTSVFGGGTPNSEYEFLTGNTMLFLPTGAIAYQQYIHDSIWSMAQVLKMNGYRTLAMHPSLSNSWMRESIWPKLGFEECIFIDGFPQKDIQRNFVTDSEMFDTIIQIYTDKKVTGDSSVFIFGVTMQNHGGYTYSGNDFTSTIKLDYNSIYSDAEQYLACLQKTDRAVEGLIKYFSQSQDDVVVLFFGDHFPKLNDSFFEEIHGGPFETLEEQMLQYEVPFFIWTNYDSGRERINLTSLNYLSNLVYEKAGLPLPAYNRYLQDLHELIPAMNAFGYYSESIGSFVPLHNATGKEREILREYNQIEWNGIFDLENNNGFFNIND